MKPTLDAFEQTIEDNAERFVPVSEAEKTEIETIINATKLVDENTILKSMEFLRR